MLPNNSSAVGRNPEAQIVEILVCLRDHPFPLTPPTSSGFIKFQKQHRVIRETSLTLRVRIPAARNRWREYRRHECVVNAPIRGALVAGIDVGEVAPVSVAGPPRVTPADRVEMLKLLCGRERVRSIDARSAGVVVTVDERRRLEPRLC